MKLHLGAEVPIDCLSVEEGRYASEHFRKPTHCILLSGHPEHACNGNIHTPVLIDLCRELFATRGRQLIETGPTIVFRRSPLGENPAFHQHALQGWIQRTFFDLENVRTTFLNVFSDAITVHRSSLCKRTKYQHVQSPRWNL